MAIRKVTRSYDGVSKEVLGLDDILEQIGANPGESIDFLGLADVIGIPLSVNNQKNPITLPDTFVGKDLDLSAQPPPNTTANPTSLSFNSVGGIRSLSVTTTGVYKISSKPSWISVDRAFARNSYIFSFVAGYNNNLNDSERSGNVVFIGAGGTTILTVPVSQGGNLLTATITPSGTQTLNSSDGTTNIVVRLSQELSISEVLLSNTTDFEITEPAPPTSASGIITYTYVLTRYFTDTNKSTTLQISYQGEGVTESFPIITFNQQGFQPTLGVTPTELNYPAGGNTLYYDVVDADTNTNWSATISGTGYSHSTSNTSGFKTTAITGTSAGDRIYVKVSSHTGAAVREGTATITTTFGSNDVSKTVDLSQAAASTWGNDDITITGFAVASNGDITVPDVTTTGDISYTIQYSTTDTFASTDLVTVADGFDLVSTNTIRYVRVSVTVPNGYTNQTQTFRKTAEATQDGLPTFLVKQITMEATRAFAVNSTGTFTSPSVSVPSGITYTLRYTTGDNNTGTAYTLAFPKVSTAVTRYANAVVIVPEGYFNEGETVFKTVSDTQEVFNPSLVLTTPSTGALPEFSILGQTQSFSFESNYSWVSTIGPAGFEQSFTQTSGFTTDDLTGSGDKTIWVRALKNKGEPRDASVSVSTNFGSLDDTILVELTQDGNPTYTFSKWNGSVTISDTGVVSATLGTGGGAVTAVSTNPTSFALVSANTNRDVDVTITVPAGYNNSGGTITETVTDISQPYFDPTLSIATSTLSFAIGGQTRSFVVSSNYNWTSSVSGTGFEQSLTNSASTFTTDDIDGNGNDTIYVRALSNPGEDRTGSVSVGTTFTNRNNSDSVSLSQVGEPTFTIADWDGVVSINRQTGTVSITQGNSLNTPTFTPTSFGLVTATTNRTVSVTVKVPDTYNNHNSLVTGDVTVSQLKFLPSVSTNVSTRTFAYTGETLSYVITSNTTWSATISGTGFSHSTSPTSGFKTTAITGTSAGDTIYVKAAGHLGAERYGTATVTTTFGGSDVSTDVDLTQEEAPTFTGADIEFTRNFAVSYTGAITAPTTNPAATSIVYSTTQGGTAASFGSVSTNTKRWARVSVTVPAGYQNTNETVYTDVYAWQPFTATINVYPEPYYYGNGSESKTFNVNSNTTWTVGSYPSWITIDDTTGGGTDTTFAAEATAQSNPSIRRYGTITTSTNTAANGIVSDAVDIEQAPKSTWSLSNIPSLDTAQWQRKDLKSTVSSLTLFNFNIPYIFNFMDSNFDRTHFGFFVNNGAARSTSSHKLTSGLKTFTVTPNNDILPIQDSMNFDSNQWVSIIKRDTKLGVETNVTNYMVGIVTSYGTNPFSGAKYISVSIPTTTGYIQTTDNTVNHTSWEINQISGDASTFPRLYTRNRNATGSSRTTTIKLDDINNTYEAVLLQKIITQPSETFSGGVYLAGQKYGDVPGNGSYTNNQASTTVTYISVSIRTNFEGAITIDSDSLTGVWISSTSSGSAVGTLSKTSTTGTATQFYIRWSTGGTMNLSILGPDNTTTYFSVDITPQGSSGTGGTGDGGGVVNPKER